MLVVLKACTNPPFHHMQSVNRIETLEELPILPPVEASQLFQSEIQLYNQLHLHFPAQMHHNFRKETLDFFMYSNRIKIQTRLHLLLHYHSCQLASFLHLSMKRFLLENTLDSQNFICLFVIKKGDEILTI